MRYKLPAKAIKQSLPVRKYAEIFKGLSDETRLLMLSLLLRHGELCVCDFVAVLGISQSKASRHLRYLRNAGLLDDRRDGVWIHYRVARVPDDEAAAVLSSVKRLVSSLAAEDLEQRLKDWLRTKQRGVGTRQPRPAVAR